MAFLHGMDTGVLLNDADLSAYFNSAEVSGDAEVAETTTFGSGVVNKTYIRGQTGGAVTLGGFYDSTATSGPDVQLAAARTSSADKVLTVGVDGFAAGKRVVVANVLETNYKISAPVADVVAIGADLQADAGVDWGVSLKALDTTTGDMTTIDNGASSANGAVATMHVTANSRNGNYTVTIRHSTDNFSASDVLLASFTVVATTVTTAERLVISGTVNRYVRAVVAQAGSTGTVTSQISFARR